VTAVPIKLAITNAVHRSFWPTPRQVPELTPSVPSSVPSTASAPRPDAQLVRQLANGDDTALAALYDRYGGPLYALAFTIARDEADAEEIVLEAFLQAWRAADRFDPARGSVASWLTVIVRSRALDLVRSRARRDRVMTSAARDDGGGTAGMGQGWEPPNASVERAEREQRVSAALRALPDSQQKVIELAFYEGRSQSEIARMLKQPLGTIKTRARAGMRKLRESLGGYYMERDA
jgi:RNA polymerase sigma-70 factor (ECF subfamily)